jgi:ribosomal protein S18 acetylase RimI-like enzyme
VTAIEFTLRRATLADADDLAKLVEFASEGFSLYFWTQVAGQDRDPWEIGRQRVRSETVGVSYRNALIAEEAGTTIGALIGYPLVEESDRDDTLHPLLVPLHELMLLAPNTWYVHVLAAFPEYRGGGLGTALLREADRCAATTGTQGLSLIVSDTNTGARRLYERNGFRETARRRIIKNGWQHPGTDWVLMIKQSTRQPPDLLADERDVFLLDLGRRANIGLMICPQDRS